MRFTLTGKLAAVVLGAALAVTGTTAAASAETAGTSAEQVVVLQSAAAELETAVEARDTAGMLDAVQKASPVLRAVSGPVSSEADAVVERFWPGWPWLPFPGLGGLPDLTGGDLDVVDDLLTSLNQLVDNLLGGVPSWP